MMDPFRRLTDRIWHVQGSIALAPGQSNEDAFDRLDPLFHERGTTYERGADTLSFHKKGQAPQDKMSIFDGGVLHIRRDANGAVLQYRMASRALLYCFLAPLLFLGFAQLTIALGEYEKAAAEASGKAEKPQEEKEKVRTLHPIDKALGAPEPEKPKKDTEEEDTDYSPKPAYVFAGIFATLYVAGRVLESLLIKSVFRRSLFGPDSSPRPLHWKRIFPRWHRRDGRADASRMDASGSLENLNG